MAKRIVLIGVGGIGSHLAEPLARMLAYENRGSSDLELMLVDGDDWEEKNQTRQRVHRLGNKATGMVQYLKGIFPNLRVVAEPNYVNNLNLPLLVGPGDLVLLAVDNHKTRKLVSEHCAILDNVVLISGGNELTDGDVTVYIRVDGVDTTPPLTFYPEIAQPTDKSPEEMSCEELAKSSPQILATNLMVAACMLNAVWLQMEGDSIPYCRVYFDICTGSARAVNNNSL